MTVPVNVMNSSFLYKNLIPMNLQYFAEPEGGEENPEGGEELPNGKEEQPTKLELTQEELDKKIESEADKKLDKVLKKKESEWNDSLQSKIDEAIKENERLSKLSENERNEEVMTQRELKISEREAEIARKELRSDAVADLSAKGLPSSFADYLLAEDAEGTLKNINEFKLAFDEAVNEKVKESMRQGTPPSGTGSSKTTSLGKELAARNKKSGADLEKAQSNYFGGK